MKKQLWSALLALTLCFTLLPGATIALDAESQDGARAAETAVDADVAAVQALLNALPTPEDATAADYDAAQEACDAYEALTDEQRAQVTGAENLAALLAYFADGIEPAGDDDEGSTPATHTHYICGGDSCTEVGHTCTEKVTFIEWTDELAAQQNGEGKTASNSLPTKEGSYYLTKDVMLEARHDFEKSVNLCLNGHKVDAGEHLAFYIYKTLQLTDCGSGGCVVKDSDDQNVCVKMNSKGTFCLYGGTVEGCVGTSDKSDHGARFIMYGGAITGSKVSGVYMHHSNSYTNDEKNANTFTMYGGKINDNTCEKRESGKRQANGVYVGDIFTMYGGEISGNSDDSGTAGGVYVGKNFTMTGGTITGNSAGGGNNSGGGVYVPGGSDSTFTVGGTAKVTGNTPCNIMLYSTENEAQNSILLQSGFSGTIGVTCSVPGSTPVFKNTAREQMYVDYIGSVTYDSDALGVGRNGELTCKTHTAPDSDGKCTDCQKTIVASTGDGNPVHYIYVADAIATGENVKLLADAADPVTISSGTHSLDLNGQQMGNITVTGGELTLKDEAGNGNVGTLTISGADTTVKLEGGTYAKIDIKNGKAMADLLPQYYGYYTVASGKKTWYTSDSATIPTDSVSVAKLPLDFAGAWIPGTAGDGSDASHEKTIACGESVTLTAVGYIANGGSTTRVPDGVSYQWQVKYNDEDWADVEGATADTVTVTPAKAGTAKYRCTLTRDDYALTTGTGSAGYVTITVNKKQLTAGTDYTAPRSVTKMYLAAVDNQILIGNSVDKNEEYYGAGIIDEDTYPGAKFMYRLGTDGEWTEYPASLRYTEVGTYTIYWYLDGGDNYESVGSAENPNSITATITPIPVIVVKVEIADKTFDGTNSATIKRVEYKRNVGSGLQATLLADCYDYTATFADVNASETSQTVSYTLRLTNPNYALQKDGAAVETYSGTTTGKIVQATAFNGDGFCVNAYVSSTVSATLNLNDILPPDAGTTTFVLDADQPAWLNTDYANGKVTIDKSVGADVREITFQAFMQNYKPIEIDVDITKTEKQIPTLTTPGVITTTYTGANVEIPVGAGGFRDVNNVGGTWSWYDGVVPKNVSDSGIYGVVFTPDDGETYETIDIACYVQVNKATIPAPTFGKVSAEGTTLDNVDVTYDSTKFTFTWDDSADTEVERGERYGWTMTAKGDEAANYEELTGDSLLWKSSSGSNGSGGGGGSSTSATTPTVKPTEGGTASVDKKNPAVGESVTVTPKPDAGYAVGEIRVTDKNGETVPVTKNADGSYSYTQPEGGVTIEVIYVAANATGFGDVPATSWYAKAVAYVRANGWMDGVGANEFAPKATVGREQFVTVLYRMAGSPAVSGSANFADVASGKYYSDAIAWALGEGIVDGIGGDMFGVGGAITREQMAVMVYRYVCAQGGGFTDAWAYQLTFTDLANVSDWALEAVAWCNMHGILTGRDDGSFDPQGTATRAEMAQLVMNWQTQGETA